MFRRRHFLSHVALIDCVSGAYSMGLLSVISPSIFGASVVGVAIISEPIRQTSVKYQLLLALGYTGFGLF